MPSFGNPTPPNFGNPVPPHSGRRHVQRDWFWQSTSVDAYKNGEFCSRGTSGLSEWLSRVLPERYRSEELEMWLNLNEQLRLPAECAGKYML
ncbi:hypothetical protein AVEN_241776-1 [Araneus ventricosus]|uniref:Uncharacterized protein n=1 Tax=Araneus ventricosus TaxID=182803 RepID=A0A4Y2VBL3_ARAVE|nr:hypothetical protein AVEN_241776-1 [Araneus ventricosus]